MLVLNIPRFFLMFFFSSNPSFAKTPKVKVDPESRTCIHVAAEEGPDESRTVV